MPRARPVKRITAPIVPGRVMPQLEPRALAEPERAELAGELQRASLARAQLELRGLAALARAAHADDRAALDAVELQPGDPCLAAAVVPGVADDDADRRIGLGAAVAVLVGAVAGDLARAGVDRGARVVAVARDREAVVVAVELRRVGARAVVVDAVLGDVEQPGPARRVAVIAVGGAVDAVAVVVGLGLVARVDRRAVDGVVDHVGLRGAARRPAVDLVGHAVAGEDRVGPRLAGERVAPAEPGDGVVAVGAADRVRPAAARQDVVERAAPEVLDVGQHVVALAGVAVVREAVDAHRDAGRDAVVVVRDVDAVAAAHHVTAGAALEPVGAGAAADRVRAAVAAQPVVPATAEERVGEVAAVEDVITLAPVEHARERADGAQLVVAAEAVGDEAGVAGRGAVPVRELEDAAGGRGRRRARGEGREDQRAGRRVAAEVVHPARAGVDQRRPLLRERPRERGGRQHEHEGGEDQRALQHLRSFCLPGARQVVPALGILRARTV